jgi:DMSO/TMAO reductase YedYZ molybdopterin-dependent catalytic subunit
MTARWPSRALTGLAAGALVTVAALGLFAVGVLASLPFVPFSVFEWFTRVLPGRLVIFGLEATLRVLEALGLNIKNTAKTVEEVLAITSLFVGGAVLGAVLFAALRSADAGRAPRYGMMLGGAVGIFTAIIAVVQTTNAAAGPVVTVVWVLGVFVLWGWALGRLYEVAVPAGGVLRLRKEAARPAAGGPPAVTDLEVPLSEAVRISRRRFVVRMSGLVATIIVLGAELDEVLRAEEGPRVPALVKAPIPFPNADSPVKPVPGTRPEYTAPADHYRVDIDLSPPQIDASSWRLHVRGLVGLPLSLTLEQLRADFPVVDEFVTLSCISNPVGGPLIGTTLWTGTPFRDVLQSVAPLPQARFAHMLSRDGFDEIVDLELVRGDPRVLLVYAWNGQTLPAEHGFPLRVYIPDRYGMKQPKWITDIVLVADYIEGYWVSRGWDRQALMRTTSVIDVVGSDQLVTRGGSTFVPVGGIAHAGDRGISKIEVQVDNGPWQPAELRQPLSRLTWVIWRFEWPFTQGEHVFAVRAYDGQGDLQVAQSRQPFPSGATGIFKQASSLLPPNV